MLHLRFFPNIIVCCVFCVLSNKGHALAAGVFNPKDFEIRVEVMCPHAYSPKYVSYGYSLALHNDSVFVYLPYMGRVYQPVLTDNGLQFVSPVKDFKVEEKRNGDLVINFTAKNGIIYCRFLVTVRENGDANIFLSPSNAQAISYDGYLSEDKSSS